MSETDLTRRPAAPAAVRPFLLAPAAEYAGPIDGAAAAATRDARADAARGLAITLEVHGDLHAVEAEWRAFERHADRTAFQTFDWLTKWQRHIGAHRRCDPVIVLGRDTDGSLLFILPFMVEPHGPARYLSWLGSELCDYNAPLLAAQFSAHADARPFGRLWQAIVDLIRATPRFYFDLIDLQKMREKVGAQDNPFLDLPTSPNPSGAYVATLGRDWDEFYAEKRSGPTRKRERRQLKHLAEHGEVRFVDVEEPGAIELTLETLIDQKARAFAAMGVENIFARPGYREFFRDVATDPACRGLVHIGRLDVGEVTAAANMGLRCGEDYCLILSSYVDGELARLGPGRAHLHELLRYAIGQHFKRFDFTIGDEPYKRDWSDVELKLFDHLAATTVQGWMILMGAAGFRRLKRFIKQSPAVWRAFSKARTIAGSIGRR
jgi:CelD/BcsL family acetyltransferase involved in cellulose biosynthesis